MLHEHVAKSRARIYFIYAREREPITKSEGRKNDPKKPRAGGFIHQPLIHQCIFAGKSTHIKVC